MKTPYLYITILLVLFGCSKKEQKKGDQLDKIDAKKAAALLDITAGNDIMAFYSFIETPVNGIFGLKHYQTLTPATPARTVFDRLQFGGAFYDANNNIIPGGNVTFGKALFYPDPNNGFFYSFKSYAPSSAAGPRDHVNSFISVQGTTQTIAVDPVYSPTSRSAASSINTPSISTGSMYIPKRLDLGIGQMRTAPYRNDTYYTMDCYTQEQRGSYDLYWNADPMNDKGVVIILEFDDALQGVLDTALITAPVSDRKQYNALRVPDNGHYTLSFEDIKKVFPQAFRRATISVTIGRANYSFVSSPSGLEKYAIYAATASEMMLVINTIRPRP
ncbi:hypothetical protein [Chitinophaga polysaccharea]|uniref:hypothetical protein n=1 Tax=Chitinophaga polysaccharea TaxID=1293035 RepID=UPI0011572657|nr:hypothetical protein [Chitinophaga polysaccharea]